MGTLVPDAREFKRWDVDSALRYRYARGMLAIGLGLSHAFSGWPNSNGWTGVGLAATVFGCALGIASVCLTVRIYLWTKESDDERHAELTFALDELREARTKQPGSDTTPSADLSGLPDQARERLEGLLARGERIVRLTRTGSGRGAHAWLAMTTKGTVLRAFKGGRTGGWHVGALY